MNRPLVAVALVLMPACTLVIGTSKRTLAVDAGDAGDDGGELDATPPPDVIEEAPPPPEGGCTPSTTIGCIAEAGVCGSKCASDYTTCYNGCNNNKPCQQGCASTKVTCEGLCSSTCFECTVGTGCPDQASCDTASDK